MAPVPGRPVPRQPWLHELLVAVDGNATALSDTRGRMGAEGPDDPPDATGLFVDDRRVLSLLDIRLGDEPTRSVICGVRGAQVELWGSARHLGNAGPDPTVEVHRTRTVRRAGMTERVVVRSRASEPVTADLTIVLAGDGAPLPAVKDGLPPGELLPALPAAGDTDVVTSWADERHLTTVRCSRPPATVRPGDAGSPTWLVLPVEVAPGAAVEVTLDIDTRRLAASSLDADPGAHLADWAGARVTSDAPRLDRLVDRSLADLAHLLMTDPEDHGDVFAAAGTPWYLTLFGRDSLWAARLALPVSLRLAAGTLRVLARRQGQVDDERTAQEPGKILHEVRRDAVDADGRALPPVYYGTVDATALWVCLLHDAWRHGLAEQEVRALVPHLEAAMGWLERRAGESADGLLRYVDRTGTGLANQGWKDSGDSMRRRDGSIAPAPIALLEAQAYAVEAAHGAARLARALGIGHPDRWQCFGDDLAQRVRTTFWVDGPEPYLAMAVDGEGALVDGIGSNMGHVLGTGALTPDEAARVAATLTAPTLLGRHGISTLARSNPAYNPIGYHTGSVWTHDTAVCAVGLAREGHGDEARRVAWALVEAGAALGDRFPELYSGEPVLGVPAPYPAACRPQAWSAAAAVGILTAVLGLEVDVPGRSVRVAAGDGTPFGAVRVDGLRFGDVTFSVRLDRDGRVDVDGLPDDVHVSTS